MKEIKSLIYSKNKVCNNRLKLIEIEFLHKLNYWIIKCGKQIRDNNNLWIYNTQQEWAKQIYCSISTIKRTIKNLEEKRIILSKKVESKRGNQTKWYTINYKKMIYKENFNASTIYRNKWKIPLFKKKIITYYNKNNKTYNICNVKYNKLSKKIVKTKLG